MAQHPLLFPWGSDDEEERQRSRSPRGLDVKASSCSSEPLESDDSSCLLWKLPNRPLLAGRVLEHCQKMIHRLRLEAGGTELVIYKIGITHDCSSRFELYKEKGWDQMTVMYRSDNLGLVEMLEAALISHHSGTKQCRNVARGGEGMRDRSLNPKFDPPYFCYCVVARADRARWVL